MQLTVANRGMTTMVRLIVWHFSMNNRMFCKMLIFSYLYDYFG